jgi:hypothetical protein
MPKSFAKQKASELPEFPAATAKMTLAWVALTIAVWSTL